MNRTPKLNRPRTGRRGQSLVEFAVILPVFVLILVGIFDLGRAVYAYSTVNNAAREAGRLAIVDQTLAHITAEATKQSVALKPVTITVDFRDPSTPTTPNSCGTPITLGCVADVLVDYTFYPATPMIDQLVGVIHIKGETQFTVEALCVEPTQAQCPPGS